MLILVMGAPGTCKTLVRKYLCEQMGFKDRTPPIKTKDPFPFFYDSVAAYVKSLSTEDDIVLSRTYWEHKEIYIPVNIKAGLLTMLSSNIDNIEIAYRRFLDFPGPNGILYLKSEYITASNRMQMNGFFISQDCWNEYLDKYQDMFSKLSGIPFHEIFIEEEESKDFFVELDFIISSFRRETKTGTIWSKEMFNMDIIKG